jgi:hypothetical protein
LTVPSLYTDAADLPLNPQRKRKSTLHAVTVPWAVQNTAANQAVPFAVCLQILITHYITAAPDCQVIPCKRFRIRLSPSYLFNNLSVYLRKTEDVTCNSGGFVL